MRSPASKRQRARRKALLGQLRSGARRRKLARKLAEAQNWRCCYCGGADGDPTKRLDFETVTIEHVNGRSNLQDNLAAACFRCNQEHA